MTSTQASAAPDAPSSGVAITARRVAETLALAALALAVLLPGVWNTDFVQTEALRVVVAKEMLETGEYLVPHVHHEPYTRKPPLFAWQLAGLCRLTGAELTEPLARMPSVFAGVLYIFAVYWGAALLFSRRCGLIAGTMALCNWVVLDYASRAELDMTFTCWVTVSQLCLFAAVRRVGRLRWLAWAGVYFAASVATLAKGPHAVIFLGLTMAGWSWRTRDVRWLFRREHLVPAAIAFVLVVGWALYMSRAVGPSAYGRSAVVEIFIRLVPYKGSHFVSWLWNIPVFAVITLPASVPAIAMLSKRARPAEGTRDRSAVDFLLVWLVTNLVFLTIAPAKASRYMLPVFAPVALLGAIGWRMFLDQSLPDIWERVFPRFARAIFVVGLACGVAGIGLGVQAALMERIVVWPAGALAAVVLLISGVVAAMVSLSGLGRAGPIVRSGWWTRIALLVLLIRPAQVAVYYPLRAERYSERELAEALDRHVPSGQPVLVYGTAPMADMEVYSDRYFVWPDREDPNAGAEVAKGPLVYFLVREKRDRDEFQSRLRFPIVDKIPLPRKHDPYLLITVDFSRS